MFETIDVGILAIQQQALRTMPPELSLYIPLQATTSTADNAERFDLHQGMLQFLNFSNAKYSIDAKVLLLLGDTGSGKSMFAQNFYRHLWQQYQPGQAIPLWLPLPELKSPFGEAVEEVLASIGFDKVQIAELKRLHQFIIIADGYDELNSWQNIYMSNHLSDWNAKVIVTCRSQAVYHIYDFEKYFLPYHEDQPLRHQLIKNFVAPFSASQIDIYLQQHQKLTTAETPKTPLTQTQLLSIPGLSELITTPFLLYLTVEALPDILLQYQNAEITEQHKLTQAALYDVFIERWFTRQINKLQITGHVAKNEDIKPKLWEYCKSLAVKMHQLKMHHVQYNSVTSTPKKSLFAKTKIDTTPWGSFFSSDKAILRSGCPLRQWGENTYGFIHASLIEYFTTRAIYEETITPTQDVTTASTASQHQNTESATSSTQEAPALKESIHYRLFTQEHTAIRMLADRVIQNTQFTAKLFGYIEHSKTDSRYSISAANAITVLNCAEISFSGMDFRGIKIPYANLKNTMMDHTDLANANLEGVNFKNACLVGANLNQANAKDVDFEQSPSLIFNGQISNLCIGARKNLLAFVIHSELAGSKIVIWDLQNKTNLHALIGHSKKINTLAFSPDCKILASGSDDSTIILWKFKANDWELSKEVPKQHILTKHTDAVNSVFFYSESSSHKTSIKANYILMSASSDKTIRSWYSESGLPIGKPISSSSAIHIALLSPTNTFLVSADMENQISLWNSKSKDLIRKFAPNHSQRVTGLTLTQDESILVSVSHDQNIVIWDVATGSILRKIKEGHNKHITCLALSSTNQFFATGSEDQTICVWELSTGKLLDQPLYGHTGMITSLAFSTKNQILLSASHDNTIRQWHIKSDQPTINKLIAGHKGSITCLAVSASQTLLASGSKEGDILLWDIETHIPVGDTLLGHDLAVSCIAFSPKNNLLASGSYDRKLLLWNIETQKQHFSSHAEHFARITGVAFSHDGKLLASSSLDETILVRDAVTMAICFKLTDKCGMINHICFSPEHALLVSSYDKKISVWNFYNTDTLVTFHRAVQTISNVSWSPDGKTIAASWDNHIAIWDSSRLDANCLSLPGHTKTVTSLSFSPNSTLLASGSLDSSIRLWLTLNGESKFSPLQGHTQGVTAVTFINNNNFASGSQDLSVRLWRRFNNQNSDEWYSIWRSNPYILQAFSCNIHDTIELSSANGALFSQHGVKKIERPVASTTLNKREDSNKSAQLSKPPLIRSVEQGNIEEVKQLLTENVNLELLDEKGWSALQHAVNNDHKEIVQLLLLAKADVNFKNTHGDTALSLAASRGNSIIAKMLLDSHVDLQQLSKVGRTPLTIAVQNGNSDMVKLLLEASEGIDFSQNIYFTLLMIIARKTQIVNGHIEIIKLLMKYDSNILTHTDMGRTPLHVTIMQRRIELTQILLQANADPNCLNNEGQTPLQMAVLNNDAELVYLILKFKPEINKVNKDGATAIYLAVKENFIEIAQLLLDAQADLNIAAIDKNTPLHIAIINNFYPIARILVNANANVNKPSKSGITPLHLAVEKGNLELVKLLVKANADINLKTSEGNAPIHIAAMNSNIEIMTFLLGFDIDMNHTNIDNLTPLHIAVKNGAIDIVRLLIAANCDVNKTNDNNEGPLHHAVKAGNLALIEMLLRAKANINQISDTIGSALHIAADSGHDELVQLLLRYNASAEQINSNGETPFIIAVKNEHTKIIDLFITANAGVHKTTTSGNIALHYARTPEIAKLLLQCNFNINHTNKDGVTALYKAAKSGNVAVTKLLLLNQADPNIAIHSWTPLNSSSDFYANNADRMHNSWKDGSTPLHVCINEAHIELVKMLLSAGADPNKTTALGESALFLAAKNYNKIILKLLIDHHVDTNKKNNHGMTALHYLVEQDQKQLVKMIIDAQADIDLVDKNGDTPLHIAAKKNNIDSLQLLLDAKADVTKLNSDGINPLHIAIMEDYKEASRPLVILHRRSEPTVNKVINALLRAGADANAKTRMGQPAFFLAAKSYRIEILKLLIEHKADINLPDSDGSTILHCLLKQCEPDLLGLTLGIQSAIYSSVKVILDAHANLDLTDTKGNTPLHIAVQKRVAVFVELLLNAKANPNILNKDGLSPLLVAAFIGDVTSVKLLVQASAEINKQHSLSGTTSLYLAAQQGHTNVVQFLIDTKANLDQTENNNATPLYIAAQNGHLEVVRCLINAKANIHIPINNGETPLFVAAYFGFTEVLQLLLKASALINQAPDDGTTPLLIAITNGHIDAVNILLSANADVTIASKDGTTPLSKAIEKGFNDVADLICTALVAAEEKSSTSTSFANTSSSTTSTWKRASSAENATISAVNIFASTTTTAQAASENASMSTALPADQHSISNQTNK